MMQEKCKNCKFWEKDYGYWTFTGWTQMHSNKGFCHFDPHLIPKTENDFCYHFTKIE
jgi:hypothetical protein